MASPAPILHQLNNVRLQEAKALLKPFDELPQSCQRKILAWKSGWHSDTSDTLRQHLEYLNLLELSDFLMWIPFERFLNVRLLCKGGFATIWAANDYIGGRTFVLKEMSMELLQELVLTAIVSSRTDSSELGLSLVGLSKYDVQYLMVMEYASGGNLEQILSDQSVKFESLHDLYTRAFYICSALRHIHDIGLTHNDLHPGNVLAKHRNATMMVLIDIGLGKAVCRSQNSDGDDNSIFGRLAYLPPEMFEGKPYTMESDVYCIGTILWQLLCRVPPRKTAYESMGPDGLREEFPPDTPVEYRRLIEQCWRRHPAERPKIDSVVNTLWDMVVKFKPDTQLGILNPLIAKFRKRFRNQLMPGTRMYVMQRMAAYEANLAAGNLSSGFEFFDQPGSFRSKLTSPSRSQYYTREQLINYTRQLTISEGPDRPTNVCG